MNAVPIQDLERLLSDAEEATFEPEDELCFFRIALRLMISGLTYDDAVQSTYGQLGDAINGE